MSNDHTASTLPSLAPAGDDYIHDGHWAEWVTDRQVHNLGERGLTADILLAEHADLHDLRPDSVILMVGGNDFSQRLSVEHVVRTIQLVLVTLRRELPGARMIVQSILPREPQLTDRIAEANLHLRQFAPNLNAHYLDLWPALVGSDGTLAPEFAEDFTHLNDDGYAAWVDELLPALERMDDAPPMSRPISIIRQQ
jgi:lysophospholipase L1-like esterase